MIEKLVGNVRRILFAGWVMCMSTVVLEACAGAAGAAGSGGSDIARPEYVCPMPEHPEVFHEVGSCPKCGMALVERSSLRSAAILVFDGVQIIDYAAPYEVFGQAGLNVYTVAKTRDPVTTAMGSRLIPAYTFKDAPPATVLVVPGGDVDVNDAQIIAFIKERTPKVEVVMTVCTGALYLAKAGLLDGLSATTFHGSIEELINAAPKTRVVRDQRFVDNGKIVTAAGLTSGMDTALHVVEKIYGADKARETALHLEYDWKPDTKYARANMADRLLPRFDLGDGVRFQSTRSIGDADGWNMSGTLILPKTTEVFLDHISQQLEGMKWRTAGEKEKTRRAWAFADEEGRPWHAELALIAQAKASEYSVDLVLRREN